MANRANAQQAIRTPLYSKRLDIASRDGFWQLNRPDQLRQLRTVARAALARYELGTVRLEAMHYRTNAIYRVTRLRDGMRFALRIHAPGTPKAHIWSELVWLDALKADGFTVPHPILSREGDPMITVALPHVAGERICTLMAWIEGRIARKRRSPGQVWRIGGQIARLHQHATRFRPPQGFARPRWDPDSLVSDPLWQLGWRRLNRNQLRLMREIADRFKAVASDLGYGNEVFGLIHGDFTFDNVLFHRGDVRAIDFDDCGHGYYLYDIATLLDRMEWRDDYATLRKALVLGYRQERALHPEHERLLDLFLLIRWTFLGLMFLSAPDCSPGRNYSTRFLSTVVPKMRRYLRML